MTRGDVTKGLGQGASTASRAGGVYHNRPRSNHRVFRGIAVLKVNRFLGLKVHGIRELVGEDSPRHRLKGIKPSFWK